jgi:hypothetical protein
MAESEQQPGLVKRVKGRLHARKVRKAERARIRAGLQRDRIEKQATQRKSFEGGGG